MGERRENHKVAVNFCSTVFMIFFLGSALGRRTKLVLNNHQDGICKLMIDPRGYVCQEHTVRTQDGYFLSLQRIPAAQLHMKWAQRPPVLLQHGLLMDGITWLLLPQEQSLAFFLADNGFDVWIANTRGTRYSRGHKFLNSNDSAYWDWSWDELVAYDLPAMFNYVHVLTGQKLHYVGHSLGTLIALAAFSRYQLLHLSRSAALLSPIAYISQMTSPLATKAADDLIAEVKRRSYTGWGLMNLSQEGKKAASLSYILWDAAVELLKSICKKPAINCTNLLTCFTGKNCCLNSSIVDIFLDHEPQSTSTKNMIHLAQNLPLFLSYGGQDALSDTKDVQRLLAALKDHGKDKLVVQYREDYAHADYVMGVNARELVYDHILSFLQASI